MASSVRSSSSSSSSALSTSTTATSYHPVWADSPYLLISDTKAHLLPASVPQSHACIYVARQMSMIHNTVIRAINASFHQCLAIQPSTPEAADFMAFNQVLCVTLDRHRRVEQEFLFPKIEDLLVDAGFEPKVIQMQTDNDNVSAFAEGLALFRKYVTKTTGDEFNGLTFRHILESFAAPLVQHLHDQISACVRLHVLASGDLIKVWQRAEREKIRDDDLCVTAPFVFGCQDCTFELDGEPRCYPPASGFLGWAVRNWFGRIYAGVWRFCPSDLAKRPRGLMFAC